MYIFRLAVVYLQRALIFTTGADRPDLVELTLRKSLADLQLDYVDLYLIHTPITVVVDEKGAFKHHEDGTVVVDPSTDLVAIWKVNETSQKSIICLNISKIVESLFKGNGGSGRKRLD